MWLSIIQTSRMQYQECVSPMIQTLGAVNQKKEQFKFSVSGNIIKYWIFIWLQRSSLIIGTTKVVFLFFDGIYMTFYIKYIYFSDNTDFFLHHYKDTCIIIRRFFSECIIRKEQIGMLQCNMHPSFSLSMRALSSLLRTNTTKGMSFVESWTV